MNWYIVARLLSALALNRILARIDRRGNWLAIAVLCVLRIAGTTSAQVFPPDPVGYISLHLPVGQSLIGNPLDADDNSLNNLFDPLAVPLGTTLSKWDAAAGQYLPNSIFDGTSWSINHSLPPGEGALLTAPAPFTNLFVGRILEFEYPTPYTNGAAGAYLLSSRAPEQLGPGYSPVFESIIGRAPRDGEQFRWLDPTTQLLHTTSYSAGAWNNGLPALKVGQAGFFILAPEPSSLFHFVAVVLLAFGWRIRRAQTGLTLHFPVTVPETAA